MTRVDLLAVYAGLMRDAVFRVAVQLFRPLPLVSSRNKHAPVSEVAPAALQAPLRVMGQSLAHVALGAAARQGVVLWYLDALCRLTAGACGWTRFPHLTCTTRARTAPRRRCPA